MNCNVEVQHILMSKRKTRNRPQLRKGRRKQQHQPYRRPFPRNRRTNQDELISLIQEASIVQQSFQQTLDLVDEKPRLAVLLNLGSYIIQGLLLGLLMGLIAAFLTGHLPKIWTYAANTFAVMLLRTLLQWIWVLKVTPLVRVTAGRFIARMEGIQLPEEVLRRTPVNSSVGTITGPAVVSLAIATILSTETLEPAWLTDTWTIVGASVLGGAISSMMEAFALPANIYPLWHNRHPYQENPNFLNGRGA